MFIVYVLQDINGKFYKGHTNDLARRFREHQLKQTPSTSHLEGIHVVYQEEYPTREQAIIREKYFKTAAGRRFLKTKLRP